MANTQTLPQRTASAAPATGVRPRLVVFDTPSTEHLRSVLTDLFPDLQIEFPAESPAKYALGTPGLLPVWPERKQSHAIAAAAFVRDFVYPLACSDAPFVISFPFAKGELTPRALGVASIGQLDLEDISKLLVSDAIEESFGRLHLLPTRTPLTPIEERLAEAFKRQGIVARPQVRFGRFTVDFLVEQNGSRFAVEADGRAFHDAERDAARDEELLGLGLTRIVHFTGREIYWSADGCAKQVLAVLNGTPRTTGLRPRRHELDESQLQAVAHGGGAARVLAPAGAGKTRVLVERIVELVAAGVEPSRILALAFNRKAMEQLVAELGSRQIPTNAKTLFGDQSGVRCATFNAFGYRFQRERLKIRLEIDAGGEKLRELMLRAAGRHLVGTARGSHPLRAFLEARERACADLQLPEEIEVELDYYDSSQRRIVPYVDVDREYERLRVGSGLQSFDDQLAVAVKELLRSPEQRNFVQDYFSHVLVDEFQDLNAAQLALVDIVSRPWRNLFVVGDDDQLIYGWRYAKLTNILDFPQRMPAATTYVLETNYRCSASVVDASRRVIDNNQERVRKDIQARGDAEPGAVLYAYSSSFDERAAALVAFVRNAEKRVDHLRQIAVLCRYKAQQPFVAMALDAVGIKHTPLLRYRLFADGNMRLLADYIRLVHNPATVGGEQLAHLLNRPNRYATTQLVEKIRRSRNPWQALRDHLDSGDEENGYRQRALRDFVERVALVAACAWSDTNGAAVDALDEIVRAFGLEEYWRDEKARRPSSQDEADPLQLLSLVRIHASQYAKLSDFLAAFDRRATEELSKNGMDEDGLLREDDPDNDRVVISTIHAAKGREYQAVVLFDYAPDLSKLATAQREEERRVLYVGMTRARESLLLTIDTNKPLHDFIRESIASARDGEREELEAAALALRPERKAADVTLARAEDKLRQIADGREQQALGAARAAAREQAEQLTAELEALEQWLADSRIWHKLNGRRRRTTREADHVNGGRDAAKVEVERLEDDLLRLTSNPERYAEPFEEDTAAAQRRVTDLDRRKAIIDNRLSQLGLLASPAPVTPHG